MGLGSCFYGTFGGAVGYLAVYGFLTSTDSCWIINVYLALKVMAWGLVLFSSTLPFVRINYESKDHLLSLSPSITLVFDW